MIKSELVEKISATHGLFQRDAEKALNAMLDCITEALVQERRVELRGFGAFTSRTRGARTGRNPRTGESVAVAEKRAPAFRAGKDLRERLLAVPGEGSPGPAKERGAPAGARGSVPA